MTVSVDGTDRTYILDVPASDGHTPTAVVFDFPGLGEHAKEERSYSQLAEQAAQRGWLGVTPDAGGAVPLWTLPPLPGPNDINFFTAMLSDIESRYCVDSKRVFAAGISNGASFAGVLGCQPAIALAAIGMVAGINGYAVCKTVRPLPVAGFNGTNDPIVPYGGGKIFGGADQKGGGVVPAATAALADWAKRNRCGDPAPITNVAVDAQLRTYSGCQAATELYVLQGDGHTWPGAAPVAEKVLGRTNTHLSATKTLLDFFAAQHS